MFWLKVKFKRKDSFSGNLLRILSIIITIDNNSRGLIAIDELFLINFK